MNGENDKNERCDYVVSFNDILLNIEVNVNNSSYIIEKNMLIDYILKVLKYGKWIYKVTNGDNIEFGNKLIFFEYVYQT